MIFYFIFYSKQIYSFSSNTIYDFRCIFISSVSSSDSIIFLNKSLYRKQKRFQKNDYTPFLINENDKKMYIFYMKTLIENKNTKY